MSNAKNAIENLTKNSKEVKDGVRRLKQEAEDLDPDPSPETIKRVTERLINDIDDVKKTDSVQKMLSVLHRTARFLVSKGYRVAIGAAIVGTTAAKITLIIAWLSTPLVSLVAMFTGPAAPVITSIYSTIIGTLYIINNFLLSVSKFGLSRARAKNAAKKIKA